MGRWRGMKTWEKVVIVTCGLIIVLFTFIISRTLIISNNLIKTKKNEIVIYLTENLKKASAVQNFMLNKNNTEEVQEIPKETDETSKLIQIKIDEEIKKIKVLVESSENNTSPLWKEVMKNIQEGKVIEAKEIGANAIAVIEDVVADIDAFKRNETGDIEFEQKARELLENSRMYFYIKGIALEKVIAVVDDVTSKKKYTEAENTLEYLAKLRENYLISLNEVIGVNNTIEEDTIEADIEIVKESGEETKIIIEPKIDIIENKTVIMVSEVKEVVNDEINPDIREIMSEDITKEKLILDRVAEEKIRIKNILESYEKRTLPEWTNYTNTLKLNDKFKSYYVAKITQTEINKIKTELNSVKVQSTGDEDFDTKMSILLDDAAMYYHGRVVALEKVMISLDDAESPKKYTEAMEAMKESERYYFKYKESFGILN